MMRKLLFTLFALFLIHSNSSLGQTPDYFQIKKVVVDGLDCYSTPYFNFSSTPNSIKGKIIYVTDGATNYIKKTSTLVFSLQDNQSELISALKDISKENYSLKIIAEPKSFFIYNPEILSEYVRCISEGWDGYEECPIIYISLPILLCMLEDQDEYKDRYRYFLKKITKITFKSIRIECAKNVIEIPIEFPLNEIISRMEVLDKTVNK